MELNSTHNHACTLVEGTVGSAMHALPSPTGHPVTHNHARNRQTFFGSASSHPKAHRAALCAAPATRQRPPWVPAIVGRMRVTDQHRRDCQRGLQWPCEASREGSWAVSSRERGPGRSKGSGRARTCAAPKPEEVVATPQRALQPVPTRGQALMALGV